MFEWNIMDLPKRKHPRLKEYDYSQNGCYFVTICVKNKKQLLGRINVTLFTVIRSFKTMVTKEIGFSIWQSSYYDRIIESENGYLEAWRYIEENPLKWMLKKGDDY